MSDGLVEQTELEIEKPRRCGIYFTKFLKALEKKPKRAAIFSHASPDPDALGSLASIEWLLNRKFGIESDLFFSGVISHPQNVAMVNLLDPNLRPIEDYDEEKYDFKILVDTVPANAGVGDKVIAFDLVIDHHKENCAADFNGLFINLKAGSCCGTIFDLIQKCELQFDEENAHDVKVATAMLVGIATDTENLMSDDATNYEFNAWSKLFEFRDTVALQQIICFERPRFWVESKAQAMMKAFVEEGVAIVGMGMIPSKHRDMIADMAVGRP